jgi:hypothetical protein
MIGKAEELAATEQPSFTGEAAREAPEDILHYREQVAALLRVREFEQMPIENHLALVHLESTIEAALKIFAIDHKRIMELGRKVGSRLRGRKRVER